VSENLNHCPGDLPLNLRHYAMNLASAWVDSPLRPRVSQKMDERWSRLIEKWIADKEIPLFIRKSTQRGYRLKHCSGRYIVPCDNSVAHWVYAQALSGNCPTLAQIRKMLDKDEIPVAMVFLKEEIKIAKHKCTKQPANLNGFGWKICHIDPVGIGYKGDRTKLPIEDIHNHFRKYMSPNNIFLVPKVWSGLGEMPEMVDAARKANNTKKGF
jgi:hypothetical protein